MENIMNTLNLNYEGQHPSVKANLINKAIKKLAVDCNTVDELLEVYENDMIPEYDNFIRSCHSLYRTHLPLCMLHSLLSSNADVSDADKELLYKVCTEKYLKGNV